MGAGGSTEENEFFTPSEKDQIPQILREKIEKHFLDQKLCIEDFETKYERLRVDSEQRYFELERNLVDSQGKLTAETASSAQLKDQLDDLEKKYNDTAQKFRDLQDKDFSFSKQMDDLQRAKHQLEGEKDDLTALVEKNKKEIDKLSDEWKTMSLKVNDANKDKIEAMTKADDAKSKSISLQHYVSRLNQEKNQLVQEKQWLEKTLNEKSDELLAFRKDNSSRVLELQANLDEKTEELRHERDLREAQKERNERLQEQNENYIQKLKEQKDFQAQSEQQYRNENHAQEKLIQLYKNNVDEGDTHVKELTTAVEELQSMLKQASAATSELEDLRKEDARTYEEQLHSKVQEVDRLNREIQDANELLETARKKGVAMLSDESLEVLSPSAAAASRLLKSGMTLTQIYSEYVQVTENLHLEKDENKRLNQYLDQILQEIEEKAPVMKKQREDYEKCLETIEQMTRQLDTAMLESENLRVHSEDTNRRNGEFSRENLRLKRQSHDLSAQVRMLIKELSEARGTLVHVEDVDMSRNGSFAGLSSTAQEVITDNLVTFRGIEELQEQNQKLMGIVRDLTDRHEEDENIAADSKTMKLNERLQQAAEEIEELKASRDRQESMVESIVRQRDMYRVLLAQNTGAQMPIMSPTGTSTPAPPSQHPSIRKTPTQQQPSQGPAIDNTVFEETKKALNELQQEFTLYRREKGENDKLVNSQLEKFRNEASELKMLNAKISSQLDYSGERYKILQSNIEGYKKEIASLTEKNLKFTSTIVKYEQKEANLREELMQLQGNLTKAEVKVEHLRTQNETLRNIENRLSQEKEASMRENRTSQLLMANLQAIQNNLERSEFETKTTYSNRIDQLDRENVQLKRKLDGDNEHQRSMIQSLEKQLTQARELLGQEDQSHRNAQNQVKAQKIEIETLKAKISQSEALHKATQERLSAVTKAQSHQQSVPTESNRVYEEEIKDLKNKINTLCEDIKSLKDQLNKAHQHEQQYKNIANTTEKNMSEQSRTTKEFKDMMEAEVKSTKQALQETKDLIKVVEKEKETLLQENIKLSHEISSSSTELRTQLKTLQTELEAAVQRQEIAIVNEQAAKNDMTEQLKRANEATDKYQREFMLHAADMTSLQEAKKELEGFEEQIRKSEEVAKEAKDKLEFEKHAWVERENLLKADRKKLQDRIDEILEQNSVLHDNLEQLTGQMIGIQQRKNSEDQQSAEMAERFAKDPGEKTLGQLTEVIKYLRKENTISVTKLEVLEAESNRYKQQAEYLQKQYDDANKVINEEREKAQVSIQTAAQHADLLRRVENLDVLQDSNRHLREEKDRLNHKMKELEGRSTKLEADIEPIQTTLREVTVERDTLQADCQAQKAEIESWKKRANHLIEQCNKCDPEEFKQAIKDRDDLKKTNNTLQGEVNQLKAEGVNLKMQLSHLKNEEASSKTKLTETMKEKEDLSKSLKAQLETQKSDVESKEKTIIQLRNIGRKYRKQTEDAQKELEALKKNKEQQVNVQELQQKVKELEEQVKAADEKLKAAEKVHEENKKSTDLQIKTLEDKIKIKETEMQGFEDKLKTTEECLKTSEAKRKGIEERLKTAEEKHKAMENSQKVSEEKVKLIEKQNASAVASSTANVQKVEKEKTEIMSKLSVAENKLKAHENSIKQLNEELNQLKETKTTLVKAKGEAESERDKNRKLVNVARGKLMQQKKEIEVLTSENSSLKSSSSNSATEQEQRLKLIQNQMERQKTELEATKQTKQELEIMKQELENVKKQNNELTQKTSQLSKLLEIQQKIQSPPGSQIQTSSEPKTANIRPMTAPTSTPQVPMAQATPMQQVRSTSIAETRAMASIRPMAVSPATSSTQSVNPSPQLPQTPTATVHPTTMEASEGMMSPLHVSTTQGRPTQSVQPVSPHIDDVTVSVYEAPTAPQEVSSSSSTPSSLQPSSSVSGSTTTASVQPSQLTLEVGPSTSGLGGSSSLFAPVFGPTSASIAPTSMGVSTHSSGIFGSNKRQREEEVEDDNQSKVTSQPEGPLKKSKTMAEAASLQDTSGPSTTTEAGSLSQDWPSVSGSVVREVNVAMVGPEPVQSTQKISATVEPSVEQLPEFVDTEDDESNEENTFQQQVQSSQVHDAQDEIIILDEAEEIDPGQEFAMPAEGNEAEQYSVDYVEYDEEAGEEYDEEEGIEGSAENIPQDDDVVIVEDEDVDVEAGVEMHSQTPGVTPQTAGLETQISVGSVGSSLTSQGSDPNRLAPPSQVTRMPTSGGRAQLAPFVFGGEGSQPEFGDDGIVPSTPTLFVPRRNDGFAEAISSPLVSRQFVFGGQPDLMGVTSGPDFGQLSSEVLEAPYIDFAQFGEQESPHTQTIQQLSETAAHSSTPSQQDISSTVSIEVTEPQEELEVIDSSTGIFSGQETRQSRNQTSPDGGASSSSDVIQHKEVPSTSSGSGDGQDRPDAGKPKIEPIIWDKPSASGISPRPSGSTPSRGHPLQQQQTPPLMQQQVQPQSGFLQSASSQGQPISTLGGQTVKLFAGQQKTFRSRPARGTAVRARPFHSRGGTRGAHSLHPNSGQQNIQQRGGQRGGRFIRGNPRGQYRGGQQF